MDSAAVSEIFFQALELDPEERAAFLAGACGADDALRREVESLLAVHDGHPLPEGGGGESELRPRRVGRYQIVDELGRGGMGRVYLAEDPDLGRKVALKMLPRIRFAGPEMLARFRREAQILASLNHPHVATLYSLEQDGPAPFLTMEWVEGVTLDRRLSSFAPGEGLSLGETLSVAVQIARALEYAHARGVVHRDLKPANVAITPEGRAKVLDFGLAKVTGVDPEREGRASIGAPTAEPTPSATLGWTRPGDLLGSPGYMSPEQTEGRPAGPASDLWAFGCILFECLAGRPAFAGATGRERVEATLTREPAWAVLPPRIPLALRELVRRCLEKDPSKRATSAAQVRRDLDRILSEAGGSPYDGLSGSEAVAHSSGTAGSRSRRLVRAQAALLLLAAAAVLFGFVRLRKESPPGAIGLRHVRLTDSGRVISFDLSPDDRSIAYTTDAGELVIRSVADGTERTVYRGRPHSPVQWSPSGNELLLGTEDPDDDDGMLIVPIDGSSPRRLGLIPCVAAAWTSEGNEIIAATEEYADGAWHFVRLNRLGGRLGTAPGIPEIYHLLSIFPSRTGELLLSGRNRDGAVEYWLIRGEIRRRILEGEHATDVKWARDGRSVVFAGWAGQDPCIKRIAVDPKAGRATGPSRVVRILSRPSMFREFREHGRMLLLEDNRITNLWLLERSGKNTWSSRSCLYGTAVIRHPRLSPDGGSIAFTETSPGKSVVSVLTTVDGSRRVLASLPGFAWWVAWSPDDSEVAFQTGEGSASRLYIVGVRGGEPRIACKRACSGYVYWYPDRRLRYQPSETASRNYVFLDPATGAEAPMLPVESGGTAFQSAISPDGRWAALTGNRNGRSAIGVWLVDLEKPDERLLYPGKAVPIGWSQDGRWIYLVSQDDRPVDESRRARVVRLPFPGGAAQLVADLPDGNLEFWSDVDISPDGGRITAALVQEARDLWVDTEDAPIARAARPGQ